MQKKPYNRPEIARVEMTPEDAVLTACKTSAPGPGRGGGKKGKKGGKKGRPLRTWCNRRGRRCQNREQGS